jgi:hypothetical protein
MQTIDLDGDQIEFVGAMELDHAPNGVGVRRLPAWTRPRIPDPFMDAMVSACSGVRIVFETDAEIIEIEAEVTSFRYAGNAARPQVFQLVLDDDEPIDATANNTGYFVLDSREPLNIGFEGGGLSSMRFAGLGAADGPRMRRSELWLPHAATIRIVGLRVDDNATVRRAAPTGRRTWIHYGSSISHCIEADVPTGVWPAVAARLGGVELHSFGFAGQCMLDQFVARTIRDAAADVISLKLGINIVNGDTMRERTFVPAVHGFLDTIRDGHPTTPILIVSPIFCPSAEDAPGPTIARADGTFTTVGGSESIRVGCLTLRRIRELLADIVAARAASDANLHYLDGLAVFGAGDIGDLPDLLHPNASGYVRMGERFAAVAFAAGGPLS